MKTPSRADAPYDPLETGEVLIFDTGPLRELILFHAVDQFRLERLRPELMFFIDPKNRRLDRKSYSRCGEFIARFKTKTTSAYVVVELGKWIRSRRGWRPIELWRRVYDEFQNMGMDEQSVRLLDMEINSVARYGPADMSLLVLAQRTFPKRSVILTADQKLAGECQKAGVGRVLLSEFQL